MIPKNSSGRENRFGFQQSDQSNSSLEMYHKPDSTCLKQMGLDLVDENKENRPYSEKPVYHSNEEPINTYTENLRKDTHFKDATSIANTEVMEEPPFKPSPLDEKEKETEGKMVDIPMKNHTGEKHSLPEKVDIYYFDHGNSGYYRTTDGHPARFTERLIEQTDLYATTFWAELFGTVQVGVAFVVAFILQLFRFLLCGLIRPLVIGILQLVSDYLLKPLLTIAFNGFLQPVFILGYNIGTSLRDLCEPPAQIVGFYTRELAHLIRAFRLVEIKNVKHTAECKQPECIV